MVSPLVTLARSTDPTGHTILDLKYCGEHTPMMHSLNNLRYRAHRAGWDVRRETEHMLHKRRGELIHRQSVRLGVIMDNEVESGSTYTDLRSFAATLGWGETEVLAALYLATTPRDELGYKERLIVCHRPIGLRRGDNPRILPYCTCFIPGGKVIPIRVGNSRRISPSASYIFSVPD